MREGRSLNIAGLVLGATLMAPASGFAETEQTERVWGGGGWYGQRSVQTSRGCFDVEGNDQFTIYDSGRVENELEIERIGFSGNWQTVSQAEERIGGRELVREIRDILTPPYDDRIVESCGPAPLS